MTADLLKMLDLDGSFDKAPDTVAIKAGPKKSGPVVSPKPTALKLDQWGIRRGKDCLKRNTVLQNGWAPTNPPVPMNMDANAMADFHGLAFEPDPETHEACTDPQRLEFIKTVLETPEYKALHAS